MKLLIVNYLPELNARGFDKKDVAPGRGRVDVVQLPQSWRECTRPDGDEHSLLYLASDGGHVDVA
jgi:hypothetical protein